MPAVIDAPKLTTAYGRDYAQSMTAGVSVPHGVVCEEFREEFALEVFTGVPVMDVKHRNRW
jgi:hypothetical protein